MSSTREYRNLGAVQDACAAIGTTITVMEHLLGALCNYLPEEVNEATFAELLDDVRKAHDRLSYEVDA